ncbi:MAG: lipoyl(octanoyl) transferase LipB, partial [Planctomycetes bacterium]|nr:lipoyl(octanoyl) transferase LipB [Planctomycetota bacterium]
DGPPPLPCRWTDLGRAAYGPVLEVQRRLVGLRAEGRVPDTLILVEHPPVATIGRGGREEDVLDPAIERHQVERGGAVTWHGPGQLVGYPILRLEGASRDARGLLRRLEEVLIRASGDLGVEAGRCEGRTGVWAGGRKLASLGIALRRWVSFHGFALNLSSGAEAYAAVNPCGMGPGVMTSLERLSGRTVGRPEAVAAVVRRFGEVFERRMESWRDEPYPASASAALAGSLTRK